MDHEDGPVFIDDEHDLKESTIVGASPDEVALLALDQRIRRPCAEDDFFRLFRFDPVPANVFFIPTVPAELHQILIICLTNMQASRGR